MIDLSFLPELDGLWRVFAAMLLVLLAVGISYWQRLDLEREIVVASARAFIQLIAIGYVLTFIFDQENPIWVVFILCVMSIVAARTAARRGEGIPLVGRISYVAIAGGTAVTIALLVGLGIFTFNAQTMIPVGGMILGASMATAALTFDQLKNDFRAQRYVVEEALALGASSKQASRPLYKRIMKAAMIPTLDQARSVGLVKLPGAMTGLILAGVPPLEAVQIQLVVVYMLLSAAMLTGLTCALLGYRQFFTSTHQLNLAVVLGKSA